MSSEADSATYDQDAESVWCAVINYVAVKGYTTYERADETRRLMCRTPSASLKRSAGQVIRITATALGPHKTQLQILVTSYDERKERLIGRRLLRQPRQELIDEVTRGVAQLLPVVGSTASAGPPVWTPSSSREERCG